MNPMWLVVWVSSVTAGLPEQKINAYKMFDSSPPAVSYIYNTIPDLGTPMIFNGQEYEIRSVMQIILEKKTTAVK